jgi:hypothetical protein
MSTPSNGSYDTSLLEQRLRVLRDAYVRDLILLPLFEAEVDRALRGDW